VGLASGVERDDLLYGTVPLETHVMGTNVMRRGATLIRAGIVKSDEYMRLTLDRCLRTGIEETRPAPLISLAYPEERKRP